jgi:hypothetical protein
MEVEPIAIRGCTAALNVQRPTHSIKHDILCGDMNMFKRDMRGLAQARPWHGGMAWHSWRVQVRAAFFLV